MRVNENNTIASTTNNEWLARVLQYENRVVVRLAPGPIGLVSAGPDR
jgi:hypothetical protein